MAPGRPNRPATPLALCLGGLDPSAGAGLLRDVMTLAGLGIHPMAVCTADTIQNGRACTAILPPADPLPRLEALAPHLEGRDPWGVKLGLCALEPRALAELVARVEAMNPVARIWDPILAPTAGVGLHTGPRLRQLAEVILGSGRWVVCPNLPEAVALAGPEAPPVPAGQPLADADCAALARPFLDLGAAAVWLKGGHVQGREVEDVWITREAVQNLGRAPRLPGDRRGTGCTLAAAWLGWRLLGLPGPEAAVAAARYLRGHWEPAVVPGGYGRPCFGPGPTP
jgi:hydroxymethylpyrimidine/phosphomethylpyrimidine kinase